MLNLTALVFAFLIVLCYKYRSHALGTHPRPDLKEPKGAIPLLGHLLLVASYPGARLLIHGDEPHIIEHVLKTNFPNYIKGKMLTGLLEDIIGKGFFLVDGAEWKAIRKLIVRIFNIKAFHEYTSKVFVIQGKKVIDYLGKAADEGFIVDIHNLMHHYTLDSFSVVMCGQSFGCLDNVEQKPPVAAAIDRLLTAAANRMLNPTQRIRERLTGVSKTIMEDRALIRQFFQDIVESRRKEGYHEEKKDLLQLFIEGKDEEGVSFPDGVMLDILFQTTVGGYDTAAQALSWMYYLMFRDGADKNIEKELVHEVDNVLQGVDPTFTTHKKQNYAESCFYEALRLYPSIAKNIRQCVEDDVLPGGIRIQKGDWFFWSSLVMGRSKLIWGPDATEYKPSRWMNTEKPSQFKFPAFNAGPRSCPGQQFATIQAMTIIGMIFQSFEMELVHPSETPAYGMSMTLPMVDGLKIRVRRRAVRRAN
ncbi:hypothetical protein BGZ68_007297 [Mortierella alpina]|nr:hypothetical protein BGZ68_007297 [Mortierella alpina]